MSEYFSRECDEKRHANVRRYIDEMKLKLKQKMTQAMMLMQMLPMTFNYIRNYV